MPRTAAAETPGPTPHRPSQPRRRLSASERRERIEDAATRLFGERGYGAASIDEIASLSGITPPVLYEHFPSKLALYEAVLQAHFAKLRQIWGEQLSGGELSPASVTDSFDSWFAYVEANPAAARLLFREPAAPKAAAVHRAVSKSSRDMVLGLLAQLPGSKRLVGTQEDLEMTWVVLRGVLQGLALWWVDHPKVARDRVVSLALDSIWNGYRETLSNRNG